MSLRTYSGPFADRGITNQACGPINTGKCIVAEICRETSFAVFKNSIVNIFI